MMRLGDSHRFRFMIRDGAGQFTRPHDNVLAGSGITTIRIHTSISASKFGGQRFRKLSFNAHQGQRPVSQRPFSHAAITSLVIRFVVDGCAP